MTTEIIGMLLTGLIAGVASGIFGIGGGAILIPILVLAFKFPQSAANGTSLVALLLPVGILGTLQYYRAGKIGIEHIRLGLLIAVGLFIGSYLGAKMAVHLSDRVLTKIFAGFLMLVALRLFWMK